MRVRLARLAQQDIAAATEWYELQRRGLGARLLASVDRALRDAGDNPLRFAMIHGTVRRAMIEGFPYAAYFVVLEDYVRVVAVVHIRRDPEAWQSRE
ncbi:MAG: type II toxin-antitoxin system RelE/ParE family toxin [Myxococcota bacterium]